MSEMVETIEEEYTEEERSFDFRKFKKKASEYVKNHIYVLCALAVAIVYILVSLAPFKRSDQSVWDIIGGVASGFAFAFAIARLLEGNGIVEGKRDREYTEAIDEYKSALAESKKHYSKLQEWCLKYSKQHYYDRLDEMLITTGLTHEEFIANQYRMSDYSENQQRAIEKAKTYNPIVITVEYLTSGATPNKNGEVDYTKVSVQNYVKQSSKNDTISKFIVAFIFGYWMLDPLTAWKWSALVWALAKTIIFLSFGVIKGFSAKNFVLEKLKTKVLDITAKLNLFVSDVTEEENKEETSNGK